MKCFDEQATKVFTTHLCYSLWLFPYTTSLHRKEGRSVICVMANGIVHVVFRWTSSFVLHCYSKSVHCSNLILFSPWSIHKSSILRMPNTIDAIDARPFWKKVWYWQEMAVVSILARNGDRFDTSEPAIYYPCAQQSHFECKQGLSLWTCRSQSPTYMYIHVGARHKL